MQSQNIFQVRYLKAAVISVLLLSGCAGVRTLTYPQNFTWIGKAEVSTVMKRFSNSLFRIDTAARRQSPGDSQVIIDELTSMIDEASSLMAARQSEGNAAAVTNHLLIDEHLDEFLNDLSRAKLILEDDPGKTYIVGNLTGSCTGCHQYR